MGRDGETNQGIIRFILRGRGLTLEIKEIESKGKYSPARIFMLLDLTIFNDLISYILIIKKSQDSL